mgnify:CR=1 FL=1
MDPIKTTVGATRLNGFDKPTVWTVMTPLAIKTQSANLVNAFYLIIKLCSSYLIIIATKYYLSHFSQNKS